MTTQRKNCSTSSALERTTLLNSCKKDITTAGDEAKLGVTANSAKDLYPNICISNVKQKSKTLVVLHCNMIVFPYVRNNFSNFSQRLEKNRNFSKISRHLADCEDDRNGKLPVVFASHMFLEGWWGPSIQTENKWSEMPSWGKSSRVDWCKTMRSKEQLM